MAEKSRVQAREAKEARRKETLTVWSVINNLEQQNPATLLKEYKAQVKQLIEMNRITPAKGDIDFKFTDNNVIKTLEVG